MRGKMTPGKALLHPHKAPKAVQADLRQIEGREQRIELNLYVTGYEDEPEEAAPGPSAAGRPAVPETPPSESEES